jgi:hypothetical protein
MGGVVQQRRDFVDFGFLTPPGSGGPFNRPEARPEAVATVSMAGTPPAWTDRGEVVSSSDSRARRRRLASSGSRRAEDAICRRVAPEGTASNEDGAATIGVTVKRREHRGVDE